jgi:hypothetical protein
MKPFLDMKNDYLASKHKPIIDTIDSLGSKGFIKFVDDITGRKENKEE